MKLYNGVPMPYYLRITDTTYEDIEHSGRRDMEWGNIIVTHPEEKEFHLQTKEERENKDD